MRPFALLFAVAALACQTSQTATGIPDLTEFTLIQAADSVPLGFGKVVKVGEVYLQLGEVTDSRCPVGAHCFWEGDGAATIAVHPPCYADQCKAASMVLVLHTTLQPKVGTGWGHRVELVGLRPTPVANQVVDRARYVAWVRVSRTG
jgi:hypothetical protein